MYFLIFFFRLLYNLFQEKKGDKIKIFWNWKGKMYGKCIFYKTKHTHTAMNKNKDETKTPTNKYRQRGIKEK